MQIIFKSRIWLIVLGVALGLLARWTLGGPEVSDVLPRTFSSPFQPSSGPSDSTNEPAEDIELPLLQTGSEAGLVPPIRVPEIEASSSLLDRDNLLVSVGRQFDNYVHGSSAIFEAHGEEVCASGCAASRHPTDTLDAEYFHELMKRYSNEPMSQDSAALEELIYYGPQSQTMIKEHGFSPLDSQRATLLWDELQITHAKISIRVVDEAGEIRTWLEPTLVPFDRRHVFKMETNNLQPLVTSGTAKRVGLDHIWVRL